jgi:endonuclease/exonuclease/phosphatase family metal-dependent hydrolase
VIGPPLFATLGVLFLLSMVRTFTATQLQVLFGKVPLTILGVSALVVFGTSLLPIVVGRRLAPRRSVAATAALLVLTTLLAAAIRLDWLVLAAAAVGLSAGTQWLALVHAARVAGQPSPLVIGLPLGLGIDLVLRALFATIRVVDLAIALAVPLVVVAGLLVLASGISALSGPLVWTRPGTRGALALGAVPPLLFMAEAEGLNGPQAAAAAGLGLDGGPSTQIGMLVIGIGVAVGAFVLARGWPARPIAAGALTVGAVLLWAHLPVVSLLAGAILAAGSIVAAGVLPSGPVTDAKTSTVAAAAFGIGWLLLVGTAFAFFGLYAYPPGVWAATAFVVAAALLAPVSLVPRLAMPVASGLAAIAVIVPAAWLGLSRAPATVAAPASFRVMTYDVHQGFDAGNVPGLDRMVTTIGRELPDVLVLQEVVRGWLVDDQQDVLGYLSDRLGMSYVFGPNLGDLHGNAILSRYPITVTKRVHYAREPGLRFQPRGAIFATVGGVQIVATHLDENADAGAVRMEQVRTLLREWDAKGPTLILCGCNAKPDAPELALITDAGFGDLALQSGGGGNTYPASAPSERIDYVFGVGMAAAQGHVPDSTASDHRGVVVNVTLSGR